MRIILGRFKTVPISIETRANEVRRSKIRRRRLDVMMVPAEGRPLALLRGVEGYTEQEMVAKLVRHYAGKFATAGGVDWNF